MTEQTRTGRINVPNKLVQTWFSYACQQLNDLSDACLFISHHAGKGFSLVDSTSKFLSQSKYLRDNVKAAVLRRKSVVIALADEQVSEQKAALVNAKTAVVTNINSKNYLITAPLIINKQIVGAVGFEFKHVPRTTVNTYLGKVELSIAWLNCLAQFSPESDATEAEFALRITALALSQSQSADAAMAITNELANRLLCERVSIGYVKNNEVHLDTISNSSNHVTHQKIVKHIEAAMLEAIDQRETLLFPPEPKSYYSTQEHDQLVRQHTGEFICTVPLVVGEVVKGAVMFERQGEAAAFDAKTKELCEQLAALIAPILHFRRLNDRPLVEKFKESCRSLLSSVFGSGSLGKKTIFVFVLAAFVSSFFIPWNYKVSANAMLEGAIERVVTSPEGGFVKDASARPGDTVKAGDILATLDDRDLQLEKLKWTSKQKQVSKEYREALASYNRSQIGILRAQLSQVEAQLEILEQKLNRTVITAPISGIIVSGDYTKSLGSPLERGQVLYTVSPLDDYRVVLQIDESDISEITVGMRGELTLSANAEDTFSIEVVKITPVSVAENSINYFQIEADLVSTPEFLRPGMQGVGKINIGERRLFWVLTHKMTDWIRLQLWSWW